MVMVAALAEVLVVLVSLVLVVVSVVVRGEVGGDAVVVNLVVVSGEDTVATSGLMVAEEKRSGKRKKNTLKLVFFSAKFTKTQMRTYA